MPAGHPHGAIIGGAQLVPGRSQKIPFPELVSVQPGLVGWSESPIPTMESTENRHNETKVSLLNFTLFPFKKSF